MDNDLLKAIGAVVNSAFDTKLQPLKDDISGIKADQVEMKKDIKSINSAVAVIEHDHGNSLKALHDGYSELSGKLDEHTLRFTRIEDKVDELQISVGIHDLKFEELAQ